MTPGGAEEVGIEKEGNEREADARGSHH